MQALAQLILLFIGIVGYFWILGFWWGLALIAISGLIAVANGKEQA